MTNPTFVYATGKTRLLLFATTASVLVLVNVLLAQQNKQLKALTGKSGRHMELSAGKGLPPVEGFDVEGNKVVVSYGEDPRKTMLLVFSPGCRACKENMSNWQSLIKRLDSSLYRVIALSLAPNGIEDYLAQYNLSGVPVIAEVDAKTRVEYQLSLTPQQILIGPEGKVERVWSGLLRGEEKADIERALDLGSSY
jgi:peroxiredoxin